MRQRTHNMEAITQAWESRVASAPEAHAWLDDRTWTDLTLDAVFEEIDRTEGTLGQQALYQRLRMAPVAAHLDAFEALVTRLTDDGRARRRAQAALGRLQDRNGYDVWRLMQPGAIVVESWYVVFPILALSTITVALLAIRWHGLVPSLVGLAIVDLIAQMTAAHRVSAFGAACRQIAPLVATGQALTFLQGEEIDPIVGTIRTDAARLRRLKTIARWISGDPLMLALARGGVATLLSEFANTLYEYVGMLFLLDGNAAYFGARYIRSHGDALVRLSEAMGDVDAALSVVTLRQERDDWTRPTFLPPGSAATLRDVRHPLVEHAVPNTVSLEAGRGILVTGSNMSGKSTFLRTVGVSAVLAQTLHTCVAAAYEAPVFSIQSCIGRSDDLIAGKSYYLVEVEEVLARVRASADTRPHLFLFDELFRGTNAVERIAAGEAVLREIVHANGRRTPHVVLAATHDGELVDLLRDVFTPYHFADSVGEEGLVFHYRLEPGAATTRNAITLLQLQGAPESLTRAALERAAALDRERSSGRS
jgi:hypothetical protein